ncbi:MAG: ABC transporter ATP-binding protein [bacterium]
MIHVEALNYAYPEGEFHLSVPMLEIERGEKIAVIGPSGSGKTTLLNLISGILTAGSGMVRIADTDVGALTDAQRRDFRIQKIGFVFQDFELMDYLNVRDNILHPYRITPRLKLNGEVRRRAEELAHKMNIGDKLSRHPDELSQGEKQRAAICRALLTEPDLILADEATGNLDPENKIKILNLLFATVSELGATLLAVTHDHELLPYFDRTIDFQTFRRAKNG